MNQIGSTFLSEGYVVNPARNGMEGIERVFNSIPDAVLVKLNLVDISGDMVIMKLKAMAKTQDVKCILYTENSAEGAAIAQRIGEKEGIERFVEFTSARDLLDVVNEVLKG
jgi:CheY-like chemotaxis protein